MTEVVAVLRLADVEGINLGPRERKRIGDRAANAAARPGDDGALPGEFEARRAVNHRSHWRSTAGATGGSRSDRESQGDRGRASRSRCGCAPRAASPG